MKPLEGKAAFVAGASRGIGREISFALARAGAAVAVAARSETEGKLPGTVHSVARSIVSEQGRAFGIKCDVTDEASVANAVEATIAELGRIDILVANAGIMTLARTLETPLSTWETCLRVNLTGVFLVTRAVLPHLIAQRSGSLIAITTSGVAMVNLGSNAYWVSKAGVERYYRGLAAELSEHNIAVNCLAPKKVVMTEGALASGIEVPEELIEPPRAMGAAAVFLASQDATGRTGEVLYSLDLLEELGGGPQAQGHQANEGFRASE